MCIFAPVCTVLEKSDTSTLYLAQKNTECIAKYTD